MPKTILHYRPHRMSPQILEAIFVAREHLLQEILNRLAQWQPKASRQHYLLIGPRGIGKTHVLILISHRILTTPSLSKTWVPVVFPEETYSVTRISDLLLNALRILWEETGDKDIAAVYQQVRYDDDDARVTDLVLDALRKFHRSRGVGLVFLIENINRILERQIKDKAQVHLLRKILTEEEWLVTVCTSPTYLDAVTKEDQPLFEFFQVKFLAELTQQEQLEMLEKLAAYEDNQDFRDYLQEYRSRLKALYHFTGGNPRLTIMLYDLISYQVISDIQAELDRLLDEITPFYQDRMKDINEQEGKLVETMALLAEGCTPTELAREARMDAKTVRTVLGRLEKVGYIRREQRREKKTIYIIPERLFRIWHQMNHSRASQGLIRFLLEFFSTWYQTKKQRDEAWKEIIGKLEKAIGGDEEFNDDLSKYMSYIIAVSEEGERYEREFDRIRNLILPKGKAAFEDELTQLDARYGEDGNYFLQKGNFYAKDLHEHQSALSAFQKSSRLLVRNAVPLFNQALMLEILKKPIEAKEIYKIAVDNIIDRIAPIDSFETLHALLDVLRNGEYIYAVKIAARILQEYADEKMLEEIISVLEHTREDWRRQYCINLIGFRKVQRAESLLVGYLQDSNNKIRGSAATALGRIGSEKAVEPLIKALNDEDQIVRGSAANALGIIGSEKAVEPLIKALSDEANNVRGSAATALGIIGSEKAVEPLIKALNDEDKIIRGSAANALGIIGSEKAVEPLIKALSDESNNVRGSAATALGRVDSEKAVEPLIKALSDKANNVRGSAATALGIIGSEKAVEPLIKALSDEANDVRGSAATALGIIGSEKAVEPLINALSDKAQNVRSSASIALIRIAAEKQVTNLDKVIDKIFEHLQEVNQEIIYSVTPNLLRAAFRSTDLNVISTVLESAKGYLKLAKFFYMPFEIAFEYLKSKRDPAIMERQHPEMRDAVQLLVNLFDGITEDN